MKALSPNTEGTKCQETGTQAALVTILFVYDLIVALYLIYTRKSSRTGVLGDVLLLDIN